MEKRKIKCYLCACEAEEQDAGISSLDVLVNCPDCTEYILTFAGMKYYFERSEGRELLKTKHKKELSKNVKKHFEEKGEPLTLSSKTIEAVTGVVTA
jgi:hypothetical protein